MVSTASYQIKLNILTYLFCKYNFIYSILILCVTIIELAEIMTQSNKQRMFKCVFAKYLIFAITCDRHNFSSVFVLIVLEVLGSE